MRQHIVLPDGYIRDRVVFSIVLTEWSLIFTEELQSMINRRYGVLSKIEKLFDSELAAPRPLILRNESVEKWLEDTKKIDVELVKGLVSKPLMLPPAVLKRKHKLESDAPKNPEKKAKLS